MRLLDCSHGGIGDLDLKAENFTKESQESQSHERRTTYLWAAVATSLATVCASVDWGLIWKTGNESWPSSMPRVERITVTKWMQVLSSKGAELDLVRS